MRLVPTHIARAVLDLESVGALGSADVVRSLVHFLKRKRLLGRASQVLAALDRETARRAGQVAVTAVTAHELDAPLRAIVKAKAEALFGGSTTTVQVDFRQDPALLGGVRLSSRDEQYDFSLNRVLNQLRTQL